MLPNLSLLALHGGAEADVGCGGHGGGYHVHRPGEPKKECPEKRRKRLWREAREKALAQSRTSREQRRESPKVYTTTCGQAQEDYRKEQADKAHKESMWNDHEMREQARMQDRQTLREEQWQRDRPETRRGRMQNSSQTQVVDDIVQFLVSSGKLWGGSEEERHVRMWLEDAVSGQVTQGHSEAHNNAVANVVNRTLGDGGYSYVQNNAFLDNPEAMRLVQERMMALAGY